MPQALQLVVQGQALAQGLVQAQAQAQGLVVHWVQPQQEPVQHGLAQGAHPLVAFSVPGVPVVPTGQREQQQVQKCDGTSLQLFVGRTSYDMLGEQKNARRSLRWQPQAPSIKPCWVSGLCI
jgi:hypothetical protein